MVATLFFLFADGPLLLDAVIKFLPLEEHYVRELITEFDRASRAVVLATLLSAGARRGCWPASATSLPASARSFC